MSQTLDDVARHAGVSRSTVSRVINNHPNVSSNTRTRVEEAIAQCGYRPHAVARSLATSKTNIIGMVVPESVTKLFIDPYYPLLLRGATEACNRNGYHMILSLFTASVGSAVMLDRIARSGYLEGVVLANASLDDSLIPSLFDEGISFVNIGRYPDDRVSYIDVDNVGGARMATEHLIRLGHTRIATISGPLDMVPGQDRLQGYTEVMNTHRLPVSDGMVVEGDFMEAGGRAAMTELLRAEPTAVFAASDSMAIGAIKAIRAAGLRVPEDVAMVGFDDIPSGLTIDPELTTVRQPIEQIGTLAVETLINLIESEVRRDRISATHRLVLPTELIVRGSCGSKLRRS
jgi:LacI family transcriptional regulator